MGALNCLASFFPATSTESKRKPMRTVELRVKMDCEGCERRVRNAVSSLKGVRSVDVNRKQQRVTVSGYVDASKVMKRVKRTGKRVELWPFIQYNLAHYPYVAGAYDKKAPIGFVRDIPQAFPAPNGLDYEMAYHFSDDNVNACSVM